MVLSAGYKFEIPCFQRIVIRSAIALLSRTRISSSNQSMHRS
ncbi:hypothetical protein ERO13_A09G000222v2 [Gossypium hirsutum]|uniref:Uncharacterized protein n=1 Tax=Gossypium barbadense TaxID=3634 RepID=A0A5J5WW56_GOSBA|nr:hypothetical protein ES319_A01G137500v1 [Gossypium barbadense]KAG4181709.1 hypothetical protein ERO13_A09G000222v2 [Gossypium hirsutum]